MPPPRPTTTLPALLRDAATLARRAPDAHAIWVAGRVDPKLREQVMLAVAHANACRWCTLAHRQWALAEGVSDAELAALEGQRAEEFDRRTWAAVAWAQARTRSDGRPTPREIEAELARHYDARERADLELVTTVMTTANQAVNTFDALLARLRGRPAAGSRLLDEAAVGAAVAASIAPVGAYLALRGSGRSRAVRRLLRPRSATGAS